MKLQETKAREILDSRGNPTIEVEVRAKNKWFRAAVPSGASTGSHEAVELRDGRSRYHGKGVLKATKNALSLGKRAKNKEFKNQQAFDEFLIKADGTTNKKKMGANALLGLSMAFARASANNALYGYISKTSKNKPSLPLPFANVLNGGKHAGTRLSIQEFMVVPVGAKTFVEAARMVSEVYQTLKRNAVKSYGPSAGNVGDEGGIAPPLSSTRQALDLVWRAVEENGYQHKIKLALDCAASEFHKEGAYYIDGKYLTARELAGHYLELLSSYPVVSIEDPFHEDAFDEFAAFTGVLRGRVQVVGDDLLVTNPERIRLGRHSCSALLLKVNQIGTLSEALDAASLARSFGWNIMVSHRSGETDDAFISDLATGLGCGQIKLGAPCRGERTAKYNQLLRLEENGLKLAPFKIP